MLSDVGTIRDNPRTLCSGLLGVLAWFMGAARAAPSAEASSAEPPPRARFSNDSEARALDSGGRVGAGTWRSARARRWSARKEGKLNRALTSPRERGGNAHRAPRNRQVGRGRQSRRPASLRGQAKTGSGSRRRSRSLRRVRMWAPYLHPPRPTGQDFGLAGRFPRHQRNSL